MIRKINFKQPKYSVPLVVFIPLCALVYYVMQTFGGSEDAQQTVATDRINTELPNAQAEEAGDKMYEMSRRFGDEDAFTAVGAIGEEQKKAEELEHGYSEDELNKLDAAEAERIRQQQEMEELDFTAVGAIGEEQKKAEELEHGYSEDELNKLDAAEAERIRQQQEMEELERSLAESRRQEQKKAEELEHGYSEDELNKLDAAEAERIRQQQEMEELERSLAESRRHINSFAYGDNATGSTGNSRTDQRGISSGTAEGYTSQDDFAKDLEEIQRRSYERQKAAYGDNAPSGNRSNNGSRTASSTPTDGYTSQDEFAKDLEEIQRRSYERQKAIERGLGIGRFDRDEQAEKQRKDSIARVRQAEKERNRPKLVIKSGDTNAEKFHTVTSPDDVAEAKLIRAMIDQTTKAKEGTRLRFKLFPLSRSTRLKRNATVPSSSSSPVIPMRRSSIQ